MPSDLFLSNSLVILFKIAIIIFALLYTGFSLIVFQRIRLLTQTLTTAIAPILTVFGFINVALAIAFLAYSILLLK